MPSGDHLTYAERLRIWRIIANGTHNLHKVAQQTGVHWFTVRRVTLDGIAELVRRIDRDNRWEDLDNLSDYHDSD